MNRFSPLLAFLLLSVSGASPVQAQSQDEIIAILNKASNSIMNGDISALDNVRALPGDHSVAGLLMFFRGNYYAYKASAYQRSVASKSAQYITESPAAEEFIRNLFVKEPGRPASRDLEKYRDLTLDSLIVARNKFSVRTLVSLFDLPNLETPPSDFSVALAKLDIPDAPFSKANAKTAATAEGVTLWKKWWEANKDQYAP